MGKLFKKDPSSPLDRTGKSKKTVNHRAHVVYYLITTAILVGLNIWTQGWIEGGFGSVILFIAGVCTWHHIVAASDGYAAPYWRVLNDDLH